MLCARHCSRDWGFGETAVRITDKISQVLLAFLHSLSLQMFPGIPLEKLIALESLSRGRLREETKP